MIWPLSTIAVAAGCAGSTAPGPDRFSATGELIALSGGGAGPDGACFTCHGLDGAGNGAGAPRLAGLDPGYLWRQLDNFADGRRRHALMEHVANRLSTAERQMVSFHYARMPFAAAGAPAAPPPVLYVAGDPQRGLPACASCHGRGGEGVGAGNPPLAGQPAPYLAAQLDAWRESRRRGDPLNRMLEISRMLRPGEIKPLAAYAAALPGEARSRGSGAAFR